jgi:glycogen operon protein
VDVESLRNRQVKNFFTLLLTAAGAPLILMGDEVRRTQQGNNNAYCQDDELSWFDWTLVEKHADILRFVKQLIDARLRRTQFRSDDDTLLELLKQAEVEFYGVNLGQPDEGYSSHSLAVAFKVANDMTFYLMINAYWKPLTFQLPSFPTTGAQGWRLWIDTNRPSPDDIQAWDHTPPVVGTTYQVGARSVAALIMAAEMHGV